MATRDGRSARACVPVSGGASVPGRSCREWETLLSDVAAPGLDSHQVMIASLDQPLDFPSEIQIQTITSCNAACVMCPYPEVSKEFALERMDERLLRPAVGRVLA